MSNHDIPARRRRQQPRGWLQFSLQTALWMMVVLAVAFGWLADRSKLQRQLAEERLEKEALRIARDYGESPLDLSALPSGYIFSSTGSTSPFFPSSGETDEATVEHLKDFLAGEPTYLAPPSGGYSSIFGTGRAIPWDGTTILWDRAFGGGVPPGSSYLDLGSTRFVSVVQDVAPKDAGSVAELIKRLTDDDATMRARAACTLARLGPNAKDAVPALIKRLTDADAAVRYHAAYALGRIRQNSPEVVAGLRAAMDDDAGPAAPLAAQLLYRIDPSIDVVPRLIELLGDSAAETRRRAIKALLTVQEQSTTTDAANDPAQAVPQLKRLVADPDTETRKAAMTAVARLAPLAEAHAMLGDVVKRGPGADRETWTFASLLWNKLDRQVRAAQLAKEPGAP